MPIRHDQTLTPQLRQDLLKLLPPDGTAVPGSVLASALQIDPSTVGRLAGLMPSSVLSVRITGRMAYRRHPSLCEASRGPR